MIWLVTMLKLSDYWIVTGYSECLPTEWIYYLYIVDQMYQVLWYINNTFASLLT